MITLQGKSVSRGVAIGVARVLRHAERKVDTATLGDPDTEWGRYQRAQDLTVKELQSLYEHTKQEVGELAADIFFVHAQMAVDEDFCDAVKESIDAGHYAEHAVFQAAKQISQTFSDMDDDYMRERAGDIIDVAERILHHLNGSEAQEEGFARGVGEIVCARDLSPSQTIQLDRERVVAFVTAEGAVNSHTAILSRSMGIPAVIGVGDAWEHIAQGDVIAVDADRGTVYLHPNEEILRDLRRRMQTDTREKAALDSYRNRESRTLDGKRVEICANVTGWQEVGEAILQGADGIGLFRSEFLYMGRSDLPGEEEQYRVYRRVLESMPDKRVVVRTLDIGADKQTPCFHLPKEENPALGLRGCRVSLSYPELFLTQCRALLRASAFGRLAVMFPLIISCDEVRALRALWDRAAQELRQQNEAFSDRVEIGIMIETPAAALICDRLAPLVDFFSIGTNDLSQYTLAIDRQNSTLDAFFDSHHEAILRLIQTTVQHAHKAGIWVGVCGEIGSDLSLIPTLLHMGVDEISVAPGTVLSLRKKVCESYAEDVSNAVQPLSKKGEISWE